MALNLSAVKNSLLEGCQILKLLFPLWLFCLFLYPTVVGWILNPSLVDYRDLGISLSWFLLFQLIFVFTQKKTFYYLTVILCFINALVNLGFWLTVDGPVTAANLFVFFNTNLEEAFGFASAKSSWSYALIIPFLILLFLAFRYPPKRHSKNKRIDFFLGIFVGVMAIGVILKNPWQGQVEKKPFPELVNSTLAFKEQMNAYNNLKQSINKKIQDIDAEATVIKNKQVYILILGESTNRNRMSLYGYSRNTNPLLSNFPGLIVYDNVVSGYAHTLESVPASLSEANLDNKMNPPESVTLMEVMKAAGFETYWLSNQSPIGIWDNVITIMAEQADHVDFVNTVGSSSFESLLKPSLDNKLFAPLQKALSDTGSKKFIVVHLMGTHLDYNLRYPPEYEVFKTNNPTWEVKWHDWYDNAVLYNDFIVDSMFQMIRGYSLANNAASATVYISDHGDLAYGPGENKMGHDYTDTMGRSLVEIPFLVWTSPDYKKDFPQQDSIIKANKKKPFVTDDLFYALLDMSGIKSPVLRPERSLFNTKYNDKRKRILVDGVDYDLLIQNQKKGKSK